jgi:hypothetical protein
VTPALARTILLHLLVVWVAVVSAWLARDGVRGLRGEPVRARPGQGPLVSGRAAAAHGAVRLAAGVAGLALAAWLLA